MGPAAGAPPEGGRRRTPVAVVVLIVARYGLIAVTAYLLVVVLRLNPVGLLLGASCAVLAAAVEAGRLLAGLRRP